MLVVEVKVLIHEFNLHIEYKILNNSILKVRCRESSVCCEIDDFFKIKDSRSFCTRQYEFRIDVIKPFITRKSIDYNIRDVKVSHTVKLNDAGT